MANTYHQMYLQVVFAVKYRRASLHEEWRKQVFGVIGSLIEETKCKTIIVNGVEDHVHCLLGLHPTVSVSELMKGVKAKSSKFINDERLLPYRFEWQEGYGAFTYHHEDVDRVFHYIARQEEYHNSQTFLDEYVSMLDEFHVPYNQRYIFHEPI
jgi:putative transposase